MIYLIPNEIKAKALGIDEQGEEVILKTIQSANNFLKKQKKINEKTKTLQYESTITEEYNSYAQEEHTRDIDSEELEL